MSFTTIAGVLAAAVATAGTFTVGYPTGTSRGDFAFGKRHRLSVLGRLLSAPEDMTLAFGASLVTVTYTGATTLPLGTAFRLQLDTPGEMDPIVDAASAMVIAQPMRLVNINLGTPLALGAATVCASQAVAAAGALVLVAGVNVPGGLGARTGRNITAVSAAAGDTAQTITITGRDMYNRIMRETFVLNGTTTRAGIKAFSSVTSVTSSASTAGNVSVGYGNAIGLPVFLPNTTFIVRELLDNALATGGTVVAGLALSTRSTATTADVRGTYVPNSATDGSRAYMLLVALNDPTFTGSTQFAG